MSTPSSEVRSEVSNKQNASLLNGVKRKNDDIALHDEHMSHQVRVCERTETEINMKTSIMVGDHLYSIVTL